MPHRRIMRITLKCLLALFVCAMAATEALAASDALLFRVFLLDGTSIVSYGEFARVGEQVIFSMPVGGSPSDPQLQAISLAASRIDWQKTDHFAASTRYQHYVATRAEADYLQLTEEVASVLSNIAQSTDRPRALALAEQARQILNDWPRTHYGYRQQDVQEIVGVLNAATARLQGGAAQPFQISLVSITELPAEPLAPMPTPREQLEQLLRVAQVSDSPSDRMALLHSAQSLLTTPGLMSAVDAGRLRRSVEEQIDHENDIDRRYKQLTQDLLARATRAAGNARIADVQRVLDRIPKEDVRLGGQRPDVVQALTVSVQTQLENARRLRLLRDQWKSRLAMFDAYQRSVGSEIAQLVKSRSALESIRKLEGPSPDRLESLHNRLRGGASRLDRLLVPEYLRSTHDLVVGAWRFAETAAAQRLKAVSSGEIGTAWEASSAAAGALMMLSRAQSQLRLLIEPPKLQ